MLGWSLLFLLIAGVCAYITHRTAFTRMRQFRLLASTKAAIDQVSSSIDPIIHVDRIEPIELSDELKNSFMSYAMSTILGRALPDARDGLKPVHRRVLYAMHALGLSPGAGYRKCARVVGEVLGKFHPHGDQSVYDALVRMAQDFVMLHPLIDGHGNFGSVDDDPAAAMRYTESRLSSLSYDSLLADIKEDTVTFVPNFDGNEEEPLVLPARLPMLLLNGGSGIAVGMATNIPPHNLGEVCDAVVALIRNPSLTAQELGAIIPAPDFPTGGKIMGLGGSRAFHETGKGSVTLRATCHFESITAATKAGTRTRNAIVITELPYMSNKAALLEKIADMVNDKKIEGIADLRDESDRDGMRVVVELKRDAVAAVVQNNLFKKTALQTAFSANMLALVDEGKQPQRLSLRKALDIFIRFRFETIRRRSRHRLEKLQSRDHIVQGLLMALERIDEIIELLRGSRDSAQAKDVLCAENRFNLTVVQADAILGLRLGRLTSLEMSKLKEEHEDLLRQIDQLSAVMIDDARVYDIMVHETVEIKSKHAVPRRSVVWEEENGTLSDEDMIANDRSVVMVTASGYVKRLPMEEFEAQSRGGKGKAGTRLATDDDKVVNFFSCTDHDVVLFISDKGIAYSVKAHQIPVGSRVSKGAPLPQVLPIASDEEITSVIPVSEFRDDEFLTLLTEKGFIKKTPLKAFKSISSRGLIIIGLEDGDSLRWARICKMDDEVLIATKDGFASRFQTSDMASTGRSSRGSRALILRNGDRMADMDILKGLGPNLATNTSARATSAISHDGKDGTKTPKYVLAVTEKGYGKRVSIDEFRTVRRGGKGVLTIKFKLKAGGGGSALRKLGKDQSFADSLSCMRVCSDDDEVVLSTRKGTIIRQRVADLSVQSRAATGVLIQKLQEGDAIVMVDIFPPEESTQDTSSDENDAEIINGSFGETPTNLMMPPNVNKIPHDESIVMASVATVTKTESDLNLLPPQARTAPATPKKALAKS